ncbi:hypothetical protein Tco_1188182 [Tanacetum coccineum]
MIMSSMMYNIESLSPSVEETVKGEVKSLFIDMVIANLELTKIIDRSFCVAYCFMLFTSFKTKKAKSIGISCHSMAVSMLVKSVVEDRKFARQMNRLRGEMTVACEERVYFVQELEIMAGVIVSQKTVESLNKTQVKDDEKMLQLQNLKREMKCDELWLATNLSKWEPMMILYCRRAITEDYRFTREINRISGELVAVLEERDHFIEELDVLAGRRVPDKTVEFLKETQAKYG